MDSARVLIAAPIAEVGVLLNKLPIGDDGGSAESGRRVGMEPVSTK